MKVALLQAPLKWEDVQTNMAYFKDKLEQIQEGTNLVVLPEMFTSGFSMNPEMAYTTMDSSIIVCLQEICRRKQFALSGSLIVLQDGKYYNRMLFIYPNGEIKHYDKRHLFSLAGEQNVYTKGKDRLIVEYMGWRICPLVCYDLRFPAYARNLNEQYDLLIYVASWPDQRIYAWDCLVKARAIENMSYLVAVNRCGTDENDNVYSGHSQVLDYLGKPLQEPLHGECIVYTTLDLEKQQKARNRFGFLKDADSFTMNL